ncbi:hypothetical protein CRE_30151 [Caenorhabditis remanei]|uniref:Uncharacterized protein n=1 Tax=Caenorhabditis remanei TaxID=31234 RepID=E3NAJ8_CAERE|nr:hypothetical protein CRE_30151 [Caenorhabditis remanei]
MVGMRFSIATVRVPSSTIRLKSVRLNNQLDTQTKTPIGSVQIGRIPYTHPSAHFYSILVFFVPSIATLPFFKEVYFKYMDRYQLTSDYFIHHRILCFAYRNCYHIRIQRGDSYNDQKLVILLRNLGCPSEVGTSKWGSKKEKLNITARNDAGCWKKSGSQCRGGARRKIVILFCLSSRYCSHNYYQIISHLSISIKIVEECHFLVRQFKNRRNSCKRSISIQRKAIEFLGVYRAVGNGALDRKLWRKQNRLDLLSVPCQCPQSIHSLI